MMTVLVIGGVWMLAAVALAFLHYVWRSRGGRYVPAMDELYVDETVILGRESSRPAA